MARWPSPTILAAELPPLLPLPLRAAPWSAGTGNGDLTFTGGEFDVQDVPPTTLNLGILGSVDIQMTGVGLTISSSAIPVVNNKWNIDKPGGAPTTMDMSLNQGTIVLDNPMGLIATYLTEPQNINLTTDPLSVSIADLLGTGLHGTADTNSIGIVIPPIATPILTSPLTVLAVLSGQIYLQAVPEPSSIAILGLGLVGLVVAGARHRRRKAS